MKTKTLLSVAAALLSSGAAMAQPAAKPPLVIERPEAAATAKLAISSADFANGAAMPLEDSSYGASKSPPLTIAGAPKRTKSFAILVEDSDGQRDGAFILHWLAYNLPASATGLPAGVPEGAALTAPVHLAQGKNTAGGFVYRGPRPPPTSAGPHHYHFEVFALDATLAEGLTDRADLVKAMAGHVLATGELVGTFSPPPAPPAN